MEQKVAFYCDGKYRECCNSPGCYKNGGECNKTFNVEHAIHFQKSIETEDEEIFEEV